MAADPRTQRLVLAGLLVVLALVGWWSFGGTSAAPAPPARPAARPPARTQASPVDTLTAGVGLDRLARVPATLADGGRDPFAPGRTEAAVGDSAGPGPRGGSPVTGPAPNVPVVPLPPSGPPPPPPIVVKFIGIVERDDVGRMAVLSDGKNVYYGREGQIVDGRWRIVRIGEESLQIEYLDGRGRQTVRLTG